MTQERNKKKRKISIIVASIVLVLVILTGACAIYVNDYYRADQAAIETFLEANECEVETLDDGMLVF